MTAALVAIAFFAAVNPFRVRPSLPEAGERARPVPAAAGIVIVFAACAVLVATATSLLEALDVSPETFRLAAGFVMAVSGAWVLWLPHRGQQPELTGTLAGLVPVAFPILFSPELFVLTLSTGADEPAAVVLAALAGSLLAAYALGAVPRRGIADSVLRGGSRLAAAVLIVVAVALIVSGIRDV